jgi:hypothetical protein
LAANAERASGRRLTLPQWLQTTILSLMTVFPARGCTKEPVGIVGGKPMRPAYPSTHASDSIPRLLIPGIADRPRRRAIHLNKNARMPLVPLAIPDGH